jgi:hypothetical protein
MRLPSAIPPTTHTALKTALPQQDMWQMAPKIIELKSDGELVIGLYRYGSPAMTYYGGNGRTHSVLVSFGNDAAHAKEGFYAVSQPLFPAAPPVWNCGMTKSMGEGIVHNDRTLFATTPTEQSKFNMYFTKYSIVYQLFGHAFKKAPLLITSINDLYSFIRFGNHTDQKQSCGGQHYSNNYYDFPHLGVLGFIMTGVVENLEITWAHDLHMMDLNLDNVSGDCKGCPGVDIWDGYQSCSPTWWNNANHWKSQSFYELWWLTGEPILLDFGNRANQKPMNSNFMGGQHRSTGHILEGLSAAYEATWDIAYRDRMRVFYKGTIDSRTTTPTNNYFQNGIVGEGLMYQYHADPGYTHLQTQLKNWGDFLCANQTEYVWGSYIGQCCWLLCGFSTLIDLYPAETKFKTISDSIWSYFMINLATSPKGLSKRAKFYNETYRGPCHYLKHLVLDPNYLNNYPDYANMTAVESRAALSNEWSTIAISPNPFKPMTMIRCRLSGDTRQNVEIKIVDISGKQVTKLNTDMHKLGTGITWNAARLSSGIYILSLKKGDRIYKKRLTLLK